MKLAFILSMPGCPSWNGRWSGEGNVYAVVKSFNTKRAKEQAAKLQVQRYFSYQWSDGWRASIHVKEVDAAEARRLSKASRGFCGYEWMIYSILKHGAIYASTDEIPKQETATA